MQLNELFQSLIDDSENNLNTLAELVDWINGQWISVDERLPPKGERVLVVATLYGETSTSLGYYDPAGPKWYIYTDEGIESTYSSAVDYWMHLPKPPKGETKNEKQ